ncbi:DUF1311 domain-containing protein [Altererythrobacter luteolus]|uniref:DUF1311 domain-containing protein n=1 Tax=Pontixanthobacter luteolus TaxID=295089 RepID=A0A6I4UZ23_9SPHN|nr:lysozyme inhibitor LprI family protein [Pontixanthobacter luteolus]MXP46838.1 DUF1311 domain-containing protein [Pontixanthobacter luteolus]
MILSLLLAASAPAVIDCEDAMTQAEMNRCAEAEYRAADHDLNAAWRLARARSGSDESGDELLQAQRAWIAFRDAHCAFEAGIYRGGSIVPLIHSNCMTSLTRARTEQLRAYVEMAN